MIIDNDAGKSFTGETLKSSGASWSLQTSKHCWRVSLKLTAAAFCYWTSILTLLLFHSLVPIHGGLISDKLFFLFTGHTNIFFFLMMYLSNLVLGMGAKILIDLMALLLCGLSLEN